MKKFLKSAGIRAFRTTCQTAVAMAGTATLLENIAWITVLSASVLSGVLSMLTSIATGLPEAETEEK